jgi:hypothetical protein
MTNNIYVLKDDEEKVQAYFSTYEKAEKFAIAAARSIYDIEEVDLDHSELEGEYTFLVTGSKPAKSCDWHGEPYVTTHARTIFYARAVTNTPEFSYDTRNEKNGILRVNCYVNATCKDEASKIARPLIEKFVAEYEASKAKP